LEYYFRFRFGNLVVINTSFADAKKLILLTRPKAQIDHRCNSSVGWVQFHWRITSVIYFRFSNEHLSKQTTSQMGNLQKKLKTAAQRLWVISAVVHWYPPPPWI